MADKKIITVFGATGAQGGGLAHAILNDPGSEFTVRAVTRDTNSEKAQELARLGAEVVAADIDDAGSIDRAMQGAYGAYCVTFFWHHMNPEKEKEEARSMAKAAKAAGLKHVIWSTLDDSRKWIPLSDNRMPTLMEKYKVPHFDAKGEANQYFTDEGVPTTFLLTSFYWDNFIHFGLGPKRGTDGKLVLTLPMADKKLASMAAEDIGKCAYGIFKRGPEMAGKTVGIAGGFPTGQEMADALGKALGEEVRYTPVTPEQFSGFGFPGADDLGNMFRFYIDFEDHFEKSRDPQLAKELNPELQSFEQWAARYAKHIPLENTVAAE